MRSIVDQSIDAVLDGDWEAATELLSESFADKSICAAEEPSYEVEPQYSQIPHYAACHLHRDEEQTY